MAALRSLISRGSPASRALLRQRFALGSRSFHDSAAAVLDGRVNAADEAFQVRTGIEGPPTKATLQCEEGSTQRIPFAPWDEMIC